MIYRFILMIIFLFTLSTAWSESIHHYQLKNGLQIFVKVDTRAPVVVSQLWYKVGSSYEPNGITGISHVLEHMLFEGTRTISGDEFARLIAQYGGDFNAMTSYDFTVYYEKMVANKLPFLLKLESDRMQNLVISPKAFAREIKIVQEERRMRTDNNPQALAYERFNAIAFMASPYHHPVIGWTDDLKNMTLEDVKKWYQQWYVPNNALLVIAGDVNPTQVYELAEKYFGAIPARPLPPIKPSASVKPLGLRTINVNAPAQLPWLITGFNVPALRANPDSLEPYALDVVATLLDGGESARLEKDLVRGKQIASSISVNYNIYSRLPTLFVISGTPNPGHSMKELEEGILDEIIKLQLQPVSKSELGRVKNQVIAEKVFARDSIFYQAMQIGTLESVGLHHQLIDEYIDKIAQITPAQIQAVAKKYLNIENMTIGKLRPENNHQTDKTPTNTNLGSPYVH